MAITVLIAKRNFSTTHLFGGNQNSMILFLHTSFSKVFTVGNYKSYWLEKLKPKQSTQEGGRKWYCKSACSRGEVVSPKNI